MTPQEELELTDTAIRNCLVAQGYSAPGGLQKQMALYGSLTKRRDELLRQIADGSSSSMCSLLSLEGPSL